MAKRKSLCDKVKKLKQKGKFAVVKYDKIYSNEFEIIGDNLYKEISKLFIFYRF